MASACDVTGRAGSAIAAGFSPSFLPWIYYQPLWTMLSVTLMILTIYALAAHGGRRDPWI